jgi:hypothetical protein
MGIDYKNIVGITAIGVAIISYIPYFGDIFAGKTKPHAFSWLVWGVLNAIVFFGQLSDGGGAGSWVVGFTAAVTLSIFFIALKKGEKNIVAFDWFCLVGAGAALVPWLITNDPLLSVILVTIIDLLGFIPTIRKSYEKPHQETLITFALSTVKYFLAIVALQNYSWVTALFPLAMVIANIFFVALLIVRRKQTSHNSAK